MHTQDAIGFLDCPETLREIVAASLEACGLEEEIDYTLEVMREFEMKGT